jgi:DNA-binding PadR family transcriptional regulator
MSQPLDEHYGLEIANAAELKSGTIYPILARLERAGWVVSEWEQIDPVAEGRRPRRYYRLSQAGAERAGSAVRQAERLVGTLGGGTWGRLAPGDSVQ